MYVITKISSDDEKYELFAFLEDGKYSSPALQCVNGKNSWIWDNPIYLYTTLFSILTTKKKINTIKKNIPLEDFEVVLELLNKGEELGFFNNKEI